MTKEDIEKAAVDSCVIENEIFNPELTPYYEQGFKDGANWRINSIWHDARKEVPEEFTPILVNRDDFTFSVNMVGGNMTSCPLHWVHWAYINDLLPERKEETK